MAGNPTRHKGSAAFLSLGLTEADQVNLSGIARGLDNINVDEQEQTRPVPGGGVTRTVQALGYRKGNANLSIDENVYTGRCFMGRTAGVCTLFMGLRVTGLAVRSLRLRRSVRLLITLSRLGCAGFL